MDIKVFATIIVIFYLVITILFLINTTKYHEKPIQQILHFYLNKSDYFGRFNSKDIALRKCKSSKECKISYISSLREPTKKEKKLLAKSTKMIDDILRNKFNKLIEIPWKFIIFGIENESGFPHTHGPFIMLPQDFQYLRDLEKTLLHEKLHVFQRYYPLETNDLFVNYMGYRIFGIEKSDNHRANPDTTIVVYMDRMQNIIDNSYKKDATKLIDITDMRDHPNEIMAYELSEVLLNSIQEEKYSPWLKKLS